jgi:hypothetical protein
MRALLALALMQAPAPAATIQGIVVTAANEPIVSARVELTGSTQGVVVTLSDGKGQFAFSNLPQGRYRVSVKKEGYVRQVYGEKKPGDEGTLVPVEGGKPTPAITFRMLPAATIAGTVRNEDGYPVANILVRAMRRTYGVRGNKLLTSFASVLTDDLGAYRLYFLDPGDYYVSASYLPQLPTPVNANEDAPRAPYASTYFPGSNDPLDAVPVSIDNGTMSGRIDLRLRRSLPVNVRGTIYSILTKSPAAAAVMLFAPEESGSAARYSTKSDDNGVFEMKLVNPGTYVLAAIALSGDGEIGFSTIKVADADYPRADVVIGPGVGINTRLFGTVPAGTDLSRIQISLIPLDSYIPAPAGSRIQPNGSITLDNVQPGKYALQVAGLPDMAYVKAAQSDSRDLLEQFVQVQYDSQAPLEIHLAFDGGQLAGTVTDSAGAGVDGATVVLIPDKGRRQRPDQYRVVTSSANGRFAVPGIPPGDYKLFAWESVESNAWLNSDFILTYEEFGSELSIGPNGKITGMIRVIPGKK